MNLSSRVHVLEPALFLTAVLVAFVSGWTLPAHAQTPADKPAPQPGAAADADLAKQLFNPVASLVLVPLQFNWDQQVGVDDDTRLTMNFQPVIPMGLNEDWNMILRWIMPTLPNLVCPKVKFDVRSQ